MNGLDATITGFISGELTLDETRSRVGEMLTSSPHLTGELLSHLQRLKEQGTLTNDGYDALSALIDSSQKAEEDATIVAQPQQHAPADDDATLLSATAVGEALPPGIIGPGALLKGRFRLENRLGEGGMGVVYKAVDLLKVEARDRNPHVAIKVLTDSFRQHSDSFIALQREASKAQRLAHPNIATVFDFDRDGGTVFMTMELLEGVPLNTYIRQLPAGGLEEEDAMGIIEELAAGLAYAHRQGLVHSDFKPGNAFFTNEGKVKVLDFGIARAAKHPSDDPHEQGGDEDKTVFDPTSLGALTPAYATIEMFEGEEPDPRDDIYALACVAYELLAGRHPFNKLSAPRARDEGLSVPLLPKLDKRQMRALTRALAFERDSRTATVEEFMHGLKRRKDYTWQIAGGSAAALLLIGAIAYNPVQTYLNNREAQRIAVEIQHGDPAVIASVLARFQEFDEEQRTLVTIAARDTLLSYFTNTINDSVDTARGHFEFPEAERQLAQAKSLYPDSAVLKELEGNMATLKSSLLGELSEKYNAALTADKLMPEEDQDDITDALDLIRRIDPNNAILGDPRLALAYASLAASRVESGNYTAADEVLGVAQRYITEDERLTDLRDKTTIALATIALNERLQREHTTLQMLADQGTPAQFLQYSELMTLVSSQSNPDELSRRVLQQLQRQTDAELSSDITRRQFDRAESQLAALAPMMPAALLRMQRTRLSDAWRQAGQTPRPLPLEKQFATLAAQQPVDAEQEAALLAAFRRELAAAAETTERDQLIEQGRTHLTDRIEAMMNSHRFTEARRLIDYSQHFTLPFQFRDNMSAQLLSAEKQYQIAQEERARQAVIAGQKQMFTAQTQSNSLREAKLTLAKLQGQLDANDPFLTNEVPVLLASAYARLAEGMANRSEWQGALENIDEALRLNPEGEGYAESRRAYRKPWLVSRLEQVVLAGNGSANEQASRLQAELKGDYAEEYPQLITPVIEALAKKIKATEATSLRQAHAMRNSTAALFDQDARILGVSLRELPKDSVAATQGTAQMENGQLTAAQTSLAEALKREASHEDVQIFKVELEKRVATAHNKFSAFEKAFDNAEYESARKVLAETLAIWKDNPEFNARKARFDFLMGKVAAGARLCRTSFGGYGNTTRATCNDVAQSSKGPLLVVIPASGRNPTPFAMSKYEISIGEYNLYCSTSKQCSPMGAADASLPVTGLQPKQIEQYIEWLSRESGYSYRLPNRAEWKFAASAGGREGNSDYNCLLRIGSQTIKGQNMVPVSLGQPNRWGLINYVGNAQELTQEGESYYLAGGSYRDAMSNCSTATLRPWNSDVSVSGFRLVRALD